MCVYVHNFLKREYLGGTSLVVHWLRVHLLVQAAWVQSLVRELRSHMLRAN